MVRLFRWFILLALILGAGRLRAASASENRAFEAAKNAFQNQFWDRAARSFADFVQKYPASMYRAEAVYYEAEAQMTNGQYAATISLLSTNQNTAGEWADDYAYLMAQAYLGSTNYHAAADEFAHLEQAFPDSPRRLNAFVSEAAALGKLEQWLRVVDLLQKPDGVFQQSVRGGATNDLVALGYLLLGEAQFAQNHLDAVKSALDAAVKLPLSAELDWRWHYLACRLQLAGGQLDDAILTATNLLPLAQAAGQPELRAESVVLQAEMFKRANRPEDAIAALRQNLSDDLPGDRQRQALLEITHLLSHQNKTAEAVTNLEDYLHEFPESEASDLAMLTLGELLLKQWVTDSATNQMATNLLPQATARFDTLLQTFPSSPLAGKALLDKGWCLWEAGRTNESADQFRLAAARLPLSEDQAVARFKWADAQFATRDFVGAIGNYYWLVEHSASLPAVKTNLLEPALYQIVRAAVTETNLSAAADAMKKILDWYPESFAGDRGLLLMGQAYTTQKDTARARELFADFEKRFPNSPLVPDVRLALARTYEQEGNWPVAIGNYDDWVITFSNNPALPQAEFCRAWDNALAGRDTNALVLFTNFVTRFPADDLAPRAQWWIGDYYFRQGDFQNAEKNYQLVYQRPAWSRSPLACPARMMAGRSAFGRKGYKDAIDYFTNLISIADCPADLKAQAMFAYGDTLRSQDSTNKTEDLNDAISILRTIPLTYGTNAQTVVAWGEIGDCYLQLAAVTSNVDYYVAASNLYQQVISSAKAGVTNRSQAAVGLGVVAEKSAAQNTTAQVALLNLALNHYLDVFYGNVLHDGEIRDDFWTKEAGMNAARVAESLQQWPQAVEVYRKMEEWFPPLHDALEKKILKIQDRPPDAKTQEARAATSVAP